MKFILKFLFLILVFFDFIFGASCDNPSYYETKRIYQNSLPPKLENFPDSEYKYPNCAKGVYIASDFTYACLVDFYVLRAAKLRGQCVFTPRMYPLSEVGEDVNSGSDEVPSYINIDRYPVYGYFQPLESAPSCPAGQKYSASADGCLNQNCADGSYPVAGGSCSSDCEEVSLKRDRLNCLCNKSGKGNAVSSKTFSQSVSTDGSTSSLYSGEVTCSGGVINKSSLVEDGYSLDSIDKLFKPDPTPYSDPDSSGFGGGGGGGGGTGGGTGGDTGGDTGGGEDNPDSPQIPDEPDDPTFCSDELLDEVMTRYADYYNSFVTNGIDCSDYSAESNADFRKKEVQNLINKYNSVCPGKSFNKTVPSYSCKSDPTDPQNPDQPTDPTNPTDPQNPDQPADPTNPTDPGETGEKDPNELITDENDKEYCTAQNTLNMLQIATDVPRDKAPGITEIINKFNEKCGKKLTVKIKDDEGTGTGEGQEGEEGEGECEGENCTFTGRDISGKDFDTNGELSGAHDTIGEQDGSILDAIRGSISEGSDAISSVGESVDSIKDKIEELKDNPFNAKSVNSCPLKTSIAGLDKEVSFDICEYTSKSKPLLYSVFFLAFNIFIAFGALKILILLLTSI